MLAKINGFTVIKNTVFPIIESPDHQKGIKEKRK